MAGREERKNMKLNDPKIIAAMRAGVMVRTFVRGKPYFSGVSKVGGKDILGFFIANIGGGDVFKIDLPMELLESENWEFVKR